MYTEEIRSRISEAENKLNNLSSHSTVWDLIQVQKLMLELIKLTLDELKKIEEDTEW